MSNDLFASQRDEARAKVAPLAARMRPLTLDEIVGQDHVVGPGRLLRRLVASGSMTSLILHGPPGTGKTSLAEVIAGATGRVFVRENAASVGVKRIREVIDVATRRIESGGSRTILFLDEIHRFTKSQQDALLADVERGLLTLIGATTENPLFSCNAALVSRSTLIRLEPIGEEAIVALLRRAIADPRRGLGSMAIEASEDALGVWAVKCDGDARRALTALEVAARSTAPDARGVVVIDRALAEESIQRKAPVYDGRGDTHYDAASAMIKSVRGSDPDAAVYWVGMMLESGEDPRFVARRLAILASEDIGNADPGALGVAAAGWELVERIGMPEARITLGQMATYLALAPKSNASYLAIDSAMRDAREGRTIPVPRIIQDKRTMRGVQAPGGERVVGKGYEYSHDSPTVARDGEGRAIGGVTSQDYLGVDRVYYEPGEAGFEATLRERLVAIREARRLAGERGDGAGPCPTGR